MTDSPSAMPAALHDDVPVAVLARLGGPGHLGVCPGRNPFRVVKRGLVTFCNRK
jgi:hypothetical protein